MGTTVITMFDVDERGIDEVMDVALEVAWKDADAVYLSIDTANITALLGDRVIMDVLATLVERGHLGNRLTADQRAAAERAREQAAGIADHYSPMLRDRHHPR